MKFLESQDHFSYYFNFEFLRKKKFHTLIGIVFSVIINLGCLVMFIIYLVELFSHSNPNVNYTKIRKTISTNLTLNTKDLLYSIGFRNKHYQIMKDPTIVSLVPVYEYMYRNNNGSLIQEQIILDIINCTVLYPKFEEIGLGNQFITNGIKDYFCFNGTYKGKSIILGGKYSSNFYGNLAIYIRKCKNSTENFHKNIICQPEKVINENVQDAWIQIAYSSSFVDSDNYSSPINYVLDGYYTRLDYTINKMLYTYFNLVNFYSENNIIFSNYQHLTAIKKDTEVTDLNLENSDGSIFTAYVCPSNTIENYKRNYIKIQEIGANIAGLFKCIFILFFLVISFYQSQLLDIKILNYFLKVNPKVLPIRRLSFITKPPSKTFGLLKINRCSTSNSFHIQPFTFRDIVTMTICRWNSVYIQKKKEYNILVTKKKLYTDYSNVIKLLIANDFRQINSNTINYKLNQSESIIENSKQLITLSEINKSRNYSEKKLEPRLLLKKKYS